MVTRPLDTAAVAPAYPTVRRATPAQATERPLDRLIRLQRVDGSWSLTPKLMSVLGLTPEAVAAIQASVPDDDADALATALALAWLERHAAEERDEWALLAAKARRRLEQDAAGAASAWLSRAEELLAGNH